ncbi:MAG: transcription elongation factor GreA [Candidatus Sumerlaeia bacterium]
MAQRPSKLENQILHFSQIGKWDKVEGLWPQLIEEPVSTARFYATIAQRAIKADKKQEMRSWAQLLIEGLYNAGNIKEMIQACLGIFRLLPEFDEVRQNLLDALRTQYSKFDQVETFLENSGLLHEAKLYTPLTRFLQYVQYSEGQVFRHGDWGVGKVVRLDPESKEVDIEFRAHGLKTFSFDGVREFLQKIPRSSFQAQRLLNPDKLAEKANAEPVEFLKFVLKYMHGHKAERADLKDELMKGVFDLNAWNRWWSNNRDSFRFDPYISFKGSPTNPVIELRKEPKSFHEEMLAGFLKADTFSRQYSIVSDMIKFRDKEEIPTSVSAEVFQRLMEGYSAAELGDYATRLEYAFLLEDLAQAQKDTATQRPLPEDILNESPDAVEAVVRINTLDFQIRAAKLLRDKRPEHWIEDAEHLFLAAPTRFGQYILREVIEEKHYDQAAHMVEQMLHRPYENVELFLWAVRTFREGKWPELHIDVSAIDIFTAVIELIEDNNRRISHDDPDSTKLKGHISRLQNLLLEKHQAIIVDAFQAMELEEARRRYQNIMDMGTLNQTFKLSFDSAVRRVVQNLDEEEDSANAEHFVTKKSYESRQKELQKLISVEIPENSKAIGAAAALGDLSENAEYESAKERQKVLFRRREALEDQLMRARVLDPDDVDSNVVGFGTEFEIRNQDTGSTERYKLLGLWDADPENNVLSYLTPFGKQFMNKKEGDNIVVNHPNGGTTRYRVLKIRNALKDGQAASA